MSDLIRRLLEIMQALFAHRPIARQLLAEATAREVFGREDMLEEFLRDVGDPA